MEQDIQGTKLLQFSHNISCLKSVTKYFALIMTSYTKSTLSYCIAEMNLILILDCLEQYNLIPVRWAQSRKFFHKYERGYVTAKLYP